MTTTFPQIGIPLGIEFLLFGEEGYAIIDTNKDSEDWEIERAADYQKEFQKLDESLGSSNVRNYWERKKNKFYPIGNENGSEWVLTISQHTKG